MKNGIVWMAVVSLACTGRAEDQENPQRITDRNRDGWNDAWVEAHPDADISRPLEDLNGDGVPLFLEMLLGLDPFAESNRETAATHGNKHDAILARLRRLEANRVATQPHLNHGLRDAQGNRCSTADHRIACRRALAPFAERARAKAALRNRRIDAWLARHGRALPPEMRHRRPSDVVDGRPEWTGALSLQLAEDTGAICLWTGSPWIDPFIGFEPIWDVGLDGTGQRIFMWDTGDVLTSHEQFASGGVFHDVDQNGNPTAPAPTAAHDHATCVACVLTGDGDPANLDPGHPDNQNNMVNPERSRGIAFGAEVIARSEADAEFEVPMMLSNPANRLYLSNHSYGTECGWQLYTPGGTWHWRGEVISAADPIREDEKFGQYRDRERAIDHAIYVAEDYLPVFAAGNDALNLDFASTPGEPEEHGPLSQGNGIAHFVYPSGGTPVLVPASQGLLRDCDGEGGSGSVPFPDTIRPQACGKNVLSVGVWRCAYGPTDDGRIKPDLVVPVIAMTDDAAYIATTTSYGDIAGSSFAAPAVTGALALLRELWTEQRGAASPTPWGSTLKALAIAGACRGDESNGPTYAVGWGDFNAFLSRELVELDTQPGRLAAHPIIKQTYLPYLPDGDGDGHGDGAIEFDIFYDFEDTEGEIIDNGCGQYHNAFDVTLCWSDPGGLQAGLSSGLDDPGPNLVNDLDLRVIGPDGTVYEPWTLDPLDPGAPAATGDNTRDNVEQVRVFANPPVPLDGVYTVRITHKNLLRDGFPEDPQTSELPKPQPVSIVMRNARALDVPFEIVSFVEVAPGGNYRMLFRSNVGATYQIERSTDLATWTAIPGDYLANATLTSVDVAVDPALPDQEFFRVRNKP